MAQGRIYKFTGKRGISWRFVVDVPVGADGERQQIRRAGFRTKKEAEGALQELLQEADAGGLIQPGKATTAEFLERWLRDIVDDGDAFRPTTQRTYRSLVRRHAIPHLGTIPLGKLRVEQIQGLYTYLREIDEEDGDPRLALKSRQLLHGILHSAFGQAVRWRLLRLNPVDGVKAPSGEPPRRPRITREMLARILAEIRGDWLYLPALFAVGCSLRRGEALGLWWSDFQLETDLPYFQLERALLDQAGTATYGRTKSRAAERPIALPGYLVEELARQQKRQGEWRKLAGELWQETGLVICQEDGSPFHPGRVSNRFRTVVEHLGYPGIHFHDLRRLHSTLLVESGIDAKTVSQRQGHSTVAMTLDVYTDVTPEMQSGAAEAMDKILRRLSEPSR